MRKMMIRTVIPGQKKKNLSFYLDDVANKLFEIKVTSRPNITFLRGSYESEHAD